MHFCLCFATAQQYGDPIFPQMCKLPMPCAGMYSHIIMSPGFWTCTDGPRPVFSPNDAKFVIPPSLTLKNIFYSLDYWTIFHFFSVCVKWSQAQRRQWHFWIKFTLICKRFKKKFQVLNRASTSQLSCCVSFFFQLKVNYVLKLLWLKVPVKWINRMTWSKVKVLPVYATNQDVVHANLLSQSWKLQALNYQSAITPHESPQELFIASSSISSTFTKYIRRLSYF